jgi:hypothetical protein
LAREVVVHDPVNPPVMLRGDLVLAVGVRAPSEEAGALVEAAGVAQAAAVVVKSPDGDLSQLRTTANTAGVTLMVLPTAMRWEQISVLMRYAITAAHSSPGSLTAVGDLICQRHRQGGRGCRHGRGRDQSCPCLLDVARGRARRSAARGDPRATGSRDLPPPPS